MQQMTFQHPNRVTLKAKQTTHLGIAETGSLMRPRFLLGGNVRFEPLVP